VSVTTSQARLAARSRIESASITDSKLSPVPFRWQNEAADSQGNTELPETASPFVYVEFLVERGTIIGFAGGRGQNLNSYDARLVAYVLVPKNNGLDEAESIGEQIAALFRCYGDGTIQCFDATVYPGGDGASLSPAGLNSPVGSYFYACAEISLRFLQIG